MTLTQLNAFVLVARLGSVTAAANALGVSESAVSQALSALRLHLGDQLVTRGPVGMTLTAGGSRLLSTASQIVVLGAEAHAAVRAAQGAPEQLRGPSSPEPPTAPALPLVTEPIFKYRLVVVTAGQPRLRGGPRQWLWFVDPSGTDPGSETGQLLTRLGISEEQGRGF